MPLCKLELVGIGAERRNQTDARIKQNFQNWNTGDVACSVGLSCVQSVLVRGCIGY